MTDYRNPKLLAASPILNQGTCTWRSPSNIAIVKYWGKYGQQLPKNPSISFTLTNAYTETTLAWMPRPQTNDRKGIALDFYFEGQRNEAFAAKILRFLESQIEVFPFLIQFAWTVSSHNSFPHSAGIASSASAMSALSLCLVDAETQLFGKMTTDAFMRKASHVSRLGSGSACRSICPTLGVWGTTGVVPGANNEYAVAFEGAHPVFSTYRDSILIVSAEEKSVSSSAGHGLMENNPFAPARYEQAQRHMVAVADILERGDVHAFGKLAEDEALSLHALMMCSQPSFVLMRPETLSVIEALRNWRKKTGLPLYFTLDAGPNVHLLYPENIATEVEAFIGSDLVQYCEKGHWIADKVGLGPQKIDS